MLVTPLLSPIHCPLGTGPRPARPLLNTDQHQMWRMWTPAEAATIMAFLSSICWLHEAEAGGHLTTGHRTLSAEIDRVRSNESDSGWLRSPPVSWLHPPPSTSTSTLHTDVLQRGRAVLQYCSDQPPPTLITVISKQSGAAPSYFCRLITVLRVAVATDLLLLW